MLFFPLLSLAAPCLAIIGQLTLPDSADAAYDPSRSSIIVQNKAQGLKATHHFLPNGTFDLGNLQEGTYRVIFQSLDLHFLQGNQYDLFVQNETSYRVYNPYAKDYPELTSGLNFSAYDVRFKEYADGNGQSFIDSLPMVPLIKKYPLIGVLIVACIGVIAAPMVIGLFDPDFNERYIEAQKKSKNS